MGFPSKRKLTFNLPSFGRNPSDLDLFITFDKNHNWVMHPPPSPEQQISTEHKELTCSDRSRCCILCFVHLAAFCSPSYNQFAVVPDAFYCDVLSLGIFSSQSCRSFSFQYFIDQYKDTLYIEVKKSNSMCPMTKTFGPKAAWLIEGPHIQFEDMLL